MVSVLPWGPQSPLIAGGILLALVAYVIVVAWTYHRLRAVVERQHAEAAEAGQFLSPRTWDHMGTALFATSLLLTSYVLLYAATWIIEPAYGLIFAPALALAPSLVLLGGILLGTAVATDAVRQLAAYLRGDLKHKPAKTLSPQIVNALHLFLRYFIYLAAGVGLAITALSALGFSDSILAAVTSWFTAQAGALLLLTVLIGVGWAGGRIIRAVTADLRWSSKRLSPEVVDTMGGAARGALYAFLGIIGIFTVLSAVGLGAIGGTMVVVLSTFIGLVVAMAATGSIGNALAGLVLMAFKPLAKGERVVLLNDLVGDVEEVSVMITRIRTVPGEVVEVPNNLVLLNRIKNLSRSGKHAIVVKLGIGYDVSHHLVRRLAIEGALRTDKILKDPAPVVFATNFGNYAIDYELHAYTTEPRHAPVRSELLGHLQESFYGAGVEIMTPDIYVIRKGKTAEPEGMVRVQLEPAVLPQEAAGRKPPA